MGKFKTLEYRLFRKLREKIKNLIIKGGGVQNTESILKKFKAEAEDLCRDYNPPKPKLYYYDVAMNALKKVDQYLCDLKSQANQSMQIEEQKD